MKRALAYLVVMLLIYYAVGIIGVKDERRQTKKY